MSFFIKDLRPFKQDVRESIDQFVLDPEPIAVLERHARMTPGALTGYIEKLAGTGNKVRAKKLLDAIDDDMLQPWLYFLLTPIRVTIRIFALLTELVR